MRGSRSCTASSCARGPRKSAQAYHAGLDQRRLAARRDHASPGRSAARATSGRSDRRLTPCATATRSSAAHLEAWSTTAARASSLAPLYPQYCAATTATANDAVFAALAAMRWQPAMRTLPPYYDDPLYIEALRANLTRQLAALDFEPERLLAELPRHAAADAASWATPIIATARRPRGCSAKRLAAKSTSRSSRASAARNGSNPRPTRRSPLIRRRASSASPSPRPDFPPIASKRWRSSAFAAARLFSLPGGEHFARARLPQRFR